MRLRNGHVLITEPLFPFIGGKHPSRSLTITLARDLVVVKRFELYVSRGHSILRVECAFSAIPRKPCRPKWLMEWPVDMEVAICRCLKIRDWTQRLILKMRISPASDFTLEDESAEEAFSHVISLAGCGALTWH
jgi:hypothetical protein